MKVSLDVKSALAGLGALSEDIESITRTMSYAMGSALEKEAKAFAPRKSGKFASSIYVAYSERSTDTRKVYAVSWNRKKAPHGHLLEFGHWRTNVVVQQSNGTWITTKEKLDTPQWVPAKPTLRPAFDTMRPRLSDIAAHAGQKRFTELVKERNK